MPLSFFWGEEDYLIEKEVNKIKQETLQEGFFELNYKVVDNPPFADFVFLLRSQSMMFGNCVYVIKCEKYFLGGKIKLNDKEVEELIEAFGLISDKIHIILTARVERGEKQKPDSRTKLFKAIQKNATVKEFPAFKAYEEYKILPVLKEMLKEHNLKADNSCLEEIIRMTGPYLRDLYSVLDKISLYIYPNNVITQKILHYLFNSSSNIFKLVDYILEKKYDKTLFEISNMLQKSHYLEILSFLETSFSRILLTKIYSKTMSSFDIARKTGQNEYAVKMSLNKIKNIPLQDLIRLKKNLVNAEFEIKTGEKEVQSALLEAFIK